MEKKIKYDDNMNHNVKHRKCQDLHNLTVNLIDGRAIDSY